MAAVASNFAAAPVAPVVKTLTRPIASPDFVVDILIKNGQADIIDRATRCSLMIVPAKFVSSRMPGEGQATFKAKITDYEIEIGDRVLPSKGGLSGSTS